MWWYMPSGCLLRSSTRLYLPAVSVSTLSPNSVINIRIKGQDSGRYLVLNTAFYLIASKMVGNGLLDNMLSDVGAREVPPTHTRYLYHMRLAMCYPYIGQFPDSTP